MQEKTIKKIGSILRFTQLHRINKHLSGKNNIRITCTHHVFRKEYDNFDSILRCLLRSRDLISPKEFFNRYKEPAFDGRLLLMTFDDGLLSSYRAAKDLLSRYNIKAIFFIPTEILGLKTEDSMRDFVAEKVYFKCRSKDSLAREEFMTMCSDDIMDLHRDGHMILPHTHSHAKLSDIDSDLLCEQEIARPRKILRELLGTEIEGFAFPVGTERVVSQAGYSSAIDEYPYCFTGLSGVNTNRTDRHFLYRDCIHAHFDLNHVRNIIDGVYDPFYRYKMSLLKKRALT